MMNTPSMYSVDQLLKARQNGVPDYVVVPMLQKAMAQKQAMAQQQALQQGAPKPPVAQQILDAAHNDVMQEHMARQVEEQPEARGIDSLPSGIDESDYAHGGIIAFAGGGGINDYPEYDASAFEPQYKDKDLDPMARKEEFLNIVGKDPAIAKQEARIGERESRLKEDEDRSPWMALMQAGLSTMAGTSPNALSNIGAGATKGLESYGESQKAIASRTDKLDELRSKIEESQRAEALAAAKFGIDSVEHRQAQNHTDRLEGVKAREEHNKNAMGHGIDVEKNAIDRLNVESDAAYKSGHLGLEREKLAQLKATNASGMSKENERAAKVLEFKIKNLDADMENDTRPGATEYYRKIKAGYINDLNKLYGDTGGGYVPYSPPAQPVKGPDFMDRVMHPIDAWNGNLPGQNPETSSTIKLPSGATAKRVG
jgi:hypothetical protein